jgi:hypothetical protein
MQQIKQQYTRWGLHKLGLDYFSLLEKTQAHTSPRICIVRIKEFVIRMVNLQLPNPVVSSSPQRIGFLTFRIPFRIPDRNFELVKGKAKYW